VCGWAGRSRAGGARSGPTANRRVSVESTLCVVVLFWKCHPARSVTSGFAHVMFAVATEGGEADEKKLDAGEDGAAPTEIDETKMEDGEGVGGADAAPPARLNTDLPLVGGAECLLLPCS
jgi:hypothetical protein